MFCLQSAKNGSALPMDTPKLLNGRMVSNLIFRKYLTQNTHLLPLPLPIINSRTDRTGCQNQRIDSTSTSPPTLLTTPIPLPPYWSASQSPQSIACSSASGYEWNQESSQNPRLQ
jgi:hypothetical protein